MTVDRPVDSALLTVAERSEYSATASSDEVLELIQHLAVRSPHLHVTELGRTFENRPIPMVIASNPLVKNAAEARTASASRSAPICLVLGNIHAGEVEGKEASLMLLREIALDANHPLLRDLILVFVPNYNADGNDRFDDVAKHRPGQVGPQRVGTRANAQGLDLNRDYIKLTAPESQALVRFLNDWDPHLTIDLHTTNGSHHRYVLTYEAPLNPSGHPAPIHFVRNELLPEVTRRVKQSTGYDMWHYGNFNAAQPPTTWATYSAQPRFGGPYQGLRNQMSILSEAYSYAPFKDRVIATREFVRDILLYTAEHKSKVIEINRLAREETARKGENPQPSDIVGIRHRIAAFIEPATVKGYEKARGGEGGAAADPHLNLGEPRDYTVIHLGRFEPTLSVQRPHGYLISGADVIDRVMDNLSMHGIRFWPVRGEVTGESFIVSAINRSPREFQGHREVSLEGEWTLDTLVMREGAAIFVPTAQPLGTLAVYLLEPQTEDGLVTWGFFDPSLEVGKAFPVMRVRTRDDLRTPE